MPGIDAGSTEINGVGEGLTEGPIMCVGTSLGFWLGDTDSVGIILGIRDGPVDSYSNSLGSVVGVRLKPGVRLRIQNVSRKVNQI
eukprot:scaffold13490_cov69-Attheya_sp.AAC.2